MPDDDWALGQNMIDVRNEERLWRHGRLDGPPIDALLEPDPERHLASGPLQPDNCDCEALCDCEET